MSLSIARFVRVPAHILALTPLLVWLVSACGGAPRTPTAAATRTAAPTSASSASATTAPQTSPAFTAAPATPAPAASPATTATPRPAPTVAPSASPAPTRAQPTATRLPERIDGLRVVTPDQLPKEARQTLALIDKRGPFPFDRDGIVFGNFEGLLPKKARGYYHEYTVITPGSRDRGARRIITGDNGEFYYTDDHYESFVRVIRTSP